MYNKINYPSVTLTKEMIDEAVELIPSTKVNRTIASTIDTLTGPLGEFAFAQYFYGDWHKNRVGQNKGSMDFANIEIKASAFPFNNKLNLLVREDYAKKRKPAFYIQIIIDVPDPKSNCIEPDTVAYICGFASCDDIDNAPLRDFGSKIGEKGGYKCHFIPINVLRPMTEFEAEYRKLKNE